MTADELRKLSDLILFQCNNTRWGSTLKMLQRYLDLSEIIIKILLVTMHNNPKAPKPVMGEDLNIIREMITVLEPIAQATELIYGEKYVTGSEALPRLKNVRTDLHAVSATTTISAEFKKALLEQFDKRFKNIEYIVPIGMATLLDPRYKKMYFRDKKAESIITNRITEQLNELTVSLNKLITSHEKSSPNDTSENLDPNHQTVKDKTHSMWSYDDELRDKLSNSVENERCTE